VFQASVPSDNLYLLLMAAIASRMSFALTKRGARWH
jgi:hypothetical protein